MIKKIKKLFDLNQNQVRLTEKTLQKIKDKREEIKDWEYSQMSKRIAEMKAELKPMVDAIPFENKLSTKKVDRIKGLPNAEKDIQAKLYEFLPEVYAFMDEVYFRKLGYRYHDVQLQAAIILAQGQRLVELYTGEGKTMTFQLPLVLYSLAGRGAHLVTVNDYLSRRDGEYAGHIASELGLSVGIVTSNASYKFIHDDQLKVYKGEESVKARKAMKSLAMSQMEAVNLIETPKRDAYNADITYGTNNEFGFDYLRDNMAWDLNNISQRELYFCIIDEADSILIDEARTPLIISGIPSDANTDKYMKFAEAVDDFKENVDYLIDHKTRSVTLTEEGIQNVENKLGVDNIWKDYSLAYHIENALKAKAMFNKDEHYLVKGGEVLIVDEFTGRILKGRRYSEGLHQALEAKERVNIQQESKTYATITFQNFFRLYKVLCGGSGTVMTEAEEFYKIYGLETVAIPTNRPVIRNDFKDRIYRTQEAKFKAVIDEIKERHEKGQPILVGTTSVDKSEIISRLLDAERIEHEVLNAKYHEQEAKIIEKAGRKGAVTVATNMAGRGADIIIGGGVRGDKDYDEVKALGGLHVIGTERHEARRIDNQLRGRTGRQGEPGSSRFYVALDDQLMKILGGEMMQGLMGRVGMVDDMPIELGMISRQIEMAQKRIEGINFDSRKQIVEYDDVMNQHREIFYSRRRSLLQSAEQASGKFFDGEKVIDLNTPDNKELKKDYEMKIEESKKRLRSLVERLMLNESSTAVGAELSQIKKWNKDNTKKIGSKFLTFVPEYLVAKAMDIQASKVVDTIADELVSKKQDKAILYFEDLMKKVIDTKLLEFGDDFYYLAKAINLQTMDNLWVDHLELMKDIREGIRLQAYAQKDPLVEYKNEAFVVFESFIKKINSDSVKQLLTVQKVTQVAEPIQAVKPETLTTNTAEIDDISTGDREFVAGATGALSSVAHGDIVGGTLGAGVAANALLKKLERDRSKKEAGIVSGKDIEGKKTGTRAFKNFNRNDKVTVKYKDGKVEKDVKFKKVEKDLMDGLAEIVM